MSVNYATFGAGTVKFAVNIFDGTGEFEICESGSVAVKGVIKVPEDVNKETLNLPEPYVPEGIPLDTLDIYKELGLRGYDYTGIFRGIKTSDNHGEQISNRRLSSNNVTQRTDGRTDDVDVFVSSTARPICFHQVACRRIF